MSYNNNHLQDTDWRVGNELGKQTTLKRTELQEQQAMRKAYCKVNNIPYEEVEIPEERGFMQGSLKVLVCLVWLFIVGVGLSVMFTDGNFINFLEWWF